MENIKETFIALCEGRLPPEIWLTWFETHWAEIEKLLNRRHYLGVKPLSERSANFNAAKAQDCAQRYLATLGVSVTLSDVYEQAYQKEWEAWLAEEERLRKEKQAQIRHEFGHLSPIYPKFFKALQKTYEITIAAGVSDADINRQQEALGVVFSEDLRQFFRLISVLRAEGVDINFAELGIEAFLGREYVFLGEFWKYGDGDALLYDVEKEEILVYAHAYPKIIKEAGNMTAFIEKRLVQYLRNV